MTETKTHPAMKMWTSDEDAFLRKWCGRYAMREIAKMLGRTKNSVIGRANRLGIVTGYRKFKS